MAGECQFPFRNRKRDLRSVSNIRRVSTKMAEVDGADRGQERPTQGMWAATKRFLTKGSARWSALVGVALLVGTVYVVSTNPGTVEQLRKKLLLNNGQGAGQKTQAVRRSLSGTDPVHRAWDDVKTVKSRPQQLASVVVQGDAPSAAPRRETGDGFSQFLAATSRSTRPALHAVAGTVSGCTSQCDANGYSAGVAGETAAKACVDVCLEEQGSKATAASAAAPKQAHSSPAADANDNNQEEAAKRLLARVQSQMPGSTQKPMPALKGKMPNSFAGIVAAVGVDGSSLPKAEQAQLQKAMSMDATIAAREANDRSSLKKSWGVSVKEMRTLDAARLENAKSLAKATQRAVSENKATLSLDAAVLSAAAQYQQNLGTAARVSQVPVDAPKAEQQLESARGAQKQIEQAAQFAGEILSEEGMKWKSGNALVQRQLNAASFVDPGSDIEGKFWAAVLKDADTMPKGAAGKVRLAAMSDGKLLAMERKNYSAQRKRMSDLGTDVRDMQAARAANALLVAKHMAKMAAQKQADTQLLAAEAHYQSTVSLFGGKSKISDSSTDLNAKILKDAQQARSLQLAAKAGMLMTQRYGSIGSSPAALTAMNALGKTSSTSVTGVDVRVSHKAHLSHEAHRGKSAKGKMTGEQAVQQAAEGWFSPY